MGASGCGLPVGAGPISREGGCCPTVRGNGGRRRAGVLPGVRTAPPAGVARGQGLDPGHGGSRCRRVGGDSAGHRSRGEGCGPGRSSSPRCPVQREAGDPRNHRAGAAHARTSDGDRSSTGTACAGDRRSSVPGPTSRNRLRGAAVRSWCDRLGSSIRVGPGRGLEGPTRRGTGWCRGMTLVPMKRQLCTGGSKRRSRAW